MHIICGWLRVDVRYDGIIYRLSLPQLNTGCLSASTIYSLNDCAYQWLLSSSEKVCRGWIAEFLWVSPVTVLSSL